MCCPSPAGCIASELTLPCQSTKTGQDMQRIPALLTYASDLNRCLCGLQTVCACIVHMPGVLVCDGTRVQVVWLVPSVSCCSSGALKPAHGLVLASCRYTHQVCAANAGTLAPLNDAAAGITPRSESGGSSSDSCYSDQPIACPANNML